SETLEAKRCGKRVPYMGNILIIEDNPGDIHLMREALREMQPPVNIQAVAEGDEALTFLRRQGKYQNAPKPHLILLDFNLPRSDARELLREIKEDNELRLIPI